MYSYLNFFIAISSFTLIVLASDRVGRLLAKFKLPMISGFLLIGILAGPYLLNLVSANTVLQLTFLDHISLAVIAFAAGSELNVKELQGRFRSIGWVIAANSIIIPLLGGLATFFLAEFIPFMQPLSVSGRVGVALLVGAILVARSPSSAIAVVNELRARGPFTRTVLGVTMVSDVVIIILFAIAISIAHVLFNNQGLQITSIFILVAELLASFVIGYLLGKLLDLLLSLHVGSTIKTALILLAGYTIFFASSWLSHYSHDNLPFELALEPLLICMIGSFVVTNTSAYRSEFLQLLHDIGPPIYVVFFTLTGAGLRLDVFVQVWAIALALFVIRLVAIFIASYVGGSLARDPRQYNILSGLTYITQAGVALGLAKEVVAEFPVWGADFATLMISTIVVSQLLGPPLFKWAIQRVGEAHVQAPSPEIDGVRDAFIFGLEGQSIALARLLISNGWNVQLATLQTEQMAEINDTDLNIQVISDLSRESLNKIGLRRADALIAMLSNDENYELCEIAYEKFGIKRMIVRLADRELNGRFAKLNAIVIEPATAMVSLLDHFVRAPAATSLLFDHEPGQQIIDLQVTNPYVHGFTIRDLRLPLDVLILSVTRNNSTLVSHGYTRLEQGDWVSVIGSLKGVEQVALQLEA